MNPNNFLTELKRRNVYKVAIAYAVIACRKRRTDNAVQLLSYGQDMMLAVAIGGCSPRIFARFANTISR